MAKCKKLPPTSPGGLEPGTVDQSYIDGHAIVAEWGDSGLVYRDNVLTTKHTSWCKNLIQQMKVGDSAWFGHHIKRTVQNYLSKQRKHTPTHRWICKTVRDDKGREWYYVKRDTNFASREQAEAHGFVYVPRQKERDARTRVKKVCPACGRFFRKKRKC